VPSDNRVVVQFASTPFCYLSAERKACVEFNTIELR